MFEFHVGLMMLIEVTIVIDLILFGICMVTWLRGRGKKQKEIE